MASTKTYDLSSFVDDGSSRTFLQHAMDGINKAAEIYPSAWEQVANGELIRANNSMGTYTSSVASIVFKEMEQDGHSGFSASWTINNITWVANGMPPEWEKYGIPEHISKQLS
jgi:hypothetical protein